jgi:hypothetical protein
VVLAVIRLNASQSEKGNVLVMKRPAVQSDISVGQGSQTEIAVADSLRDGDKSPKPAHYVHIKLPKGCGRWLWE